jgi:hypothetical protein
MTSKARSGQPSELNSTSARLRKTCDACQTIKTRCSRDKPTCVRCQSQNISCHYSVSRRIGRPRRLVPPPSPVSCSHARRLDEQIQASQFYSVDWSGVDAEFGNDRIITGVCTCTLAIMAGFVGGWRPFALGPWLAATVKTRYKNTLDKNNPPIRIRRLVPLIFCAKIRIYPL